jgi:hypothetical protein
MLQERRGVVRFAYAGVAAASDRAAHAVRAVRAAPAEHAACAVPAAAQRVMLSVRKGVKAMHEAVKAIRAAHVCYAVVSGVLRENARYLRAGRAPCANT